MVSAHKEAELLLAALAFGDLTIGDPIFPTFLANQEGERHLAAV
eukprot:CAMPEP_0206524858 /NCGR_PEP_ID=MMETSP0324_2-20121206/68411_1 /ASSEMBLY_ACC=CAM_ASM_000836 /TAXON_ID=2866 /ORGANISM="Crypthecodinium cohnii, Strain Seligo" /LENGTH=43 /DNA_ID= /DNA_START= /DNA_END= /DNA_ORIENTATION=